MLKERRRPEAARLRIYIDAIKDAELTSDATWIDAWISQRDGSRFIPRAVWLAILRDWALIEAEKLSLYKAA